MGENRNTIYNIDTNKFSKQRVKGSSTGYNINGNFVIEKNIIKIKVKNLSQNAQHQKAIQYLKTELEEMEALWGKYSSDCLGHGITCTRLKISWLGRGLAGN
jgi:hypothetical protein